MSNFFTVKGEVENLIVIQRSKFYCNIKGIESEEEAKEFLEYVNKKHLLSSHQTYAYIADEFGSKMKFSDGGEPSGTAGMPILNVLKNKKLFKVVAVVTRFFGGIKLGAGGLVRAYSNSVSECLKKAEIVEVKDCLNFKLFCDYEIYSRLICSDIYKNFIINNIKYSEKIEISISCEKESEKTFLEIKNQLLNFSCGKITIQELEDTKRAF